MSITIKFTNQFGYEVTTHQLENISSYYRTFFEDNIPVKEERYENNELVNTSYFVSTLKEINDILFTQPTSSFDYTYTQNNFHIKESLSYQNGILVDKNISVFDNDQNNICYRKFIFQNGIGVPESTQKYYYINGELKYTFDYNLDGTCFIISDEQDFQSDIYAWNIGNPDYTDFTWNGFEYYQFAEPLIPDSSDLQSVLIK